MKDNLAIVIDKVLAEEKRNPKIMVDVKRAIVEFGQKEGYKKSQTLELLNRVLTEMKKNPVTLGCVKHHWKKD